MGDPRSEAEKILGLERQWCRKLQEKDVEWIVDLFAEGGRRFTPNAEPVVGLEVLRAAREATRLRAPVASTAVPGRVPGATAVGPTPTRSGRQARWNLDFRGMVAWWRRLPMQRALVLAVLATSVGGSMLLVGCGRSDKVVSAQPMSADQTETGQPTRDNVADRERELAEREAAVAARETQLDRQEQPTMPAPRQIRPPTPSTQPPAPPPAASVPPTPTPVPPTPTPPPIPVTVATGSLVTVEFLDRLSSHESTAGQEFSARVVEPVRVPQGIAIPAGSVVTGKVTEASPAKKVGGSARLALEFTSIRLPNGETEPFVAQFSSKGKSSTGRDVAIIAGAAAGGAILGNQVIGDHGGTKGALIGAAAGAIAASQTKAKPVVIEAGTVTNLELAEPIDLTIRP